MNTRKNTWKILMKSSPETKDPQYLQRGHDFVFAFLKGFKYEDALAIVRIEGIYVETFHAADVKQTLKVIYSSYFQNMHTQYTMVYV